MRSSVRPSGPGVGVLLLLLGASAAASEEDVVATGTTPPTAQVMGWSSDEQRHAYRVQSHAEPLPPLVLEGRDEEDADAEEAPRDAASRPGAEGFCAGYVDAQGKRFRGALTVVVFERDRRVLSLPIQEEPRCTPPDVAASRLAEAMKKLTELGIDAHRPGKSLALVPGKRVEVTPEKQPPYALEVVDKLKTKALDKQGNVQVSGTLELYLHQGGERRKVYTRPVARGFHRELGGVEEESLPGAQVSPSGARVVVLGLERSGNLRQGYSATLRVATVLGGPEGFSPPEKRPAPAR